ncbi:MAG: FAD:protein FMN transferase [Minisyncoccia bacterium]
MPTTVEVVDSGATKETLEKVFDYFTSVDEKFSTYKETSEISAINRGELKIENSSEEMKEVFSLAEKTKQETNGFFDIKKPDGSIDPSGLVKGWAVHNGALILDKLGFKNFSVDVGGDIEFRGLNEQKEKWSVGIRNPFQREEIVKVVYLGGDGPMGIATSGTYIRGQHIYNPHEMGPLEEVLSLTVIGSNIYEADRFATAAFAMGREGIYFIEKLDGFEGYMIDKNGQGTATTGFENYTKKL